MARHGENIRKRVDGRWEGRYLIYSEEKKRSLYRSVYGRSYEEAKEKLFVQKELLSGRAAETGVTEEVKPKLPETLVFSAMAGEWLKRLPQEKKPSTCEKYNFIYRTYLEEALEGVSCAQITDLRVKSSL